MNKDKDERIEIVALHRAELSGGGYGQIVARRDDVEAATDPDKVETSVFKCGAKTFAPGGVYSAFGEIEDGRITRLAIKSMLYRGQAEIDDAVLAYWQSLEDQIARDKDRVAAERKAKSGKVGDRQIEELTAIAAKLPWHKRHALVTAWSNEILKRASTS